LDELLVVPHSRRIAPGPRSAELHAAVGNPALARGTLVDQRAAAHASVVDTTSEPTEVSVEDRRAVAEGVAVMYDMPRCERLRRITALHLPKKEELLLIKRVKREKNRAKYDAFYAVDELYNAAIALSKKEDATEEELRTAAVMLLRLSGMLRSADLATTMPNLFDEGQGRTSIHFVAKNGIQRSIHINGDTLAAVQRYQRATATDPPPTRLICALRTSQPIGTERLAKIALDFMKLHNINTAHYKAHSLRGAAGTHMLARGVPATAVQGRGGWSSEGTFLQHYARLHQIIDCSRALGEPVGQDAFGGFSPKENQVEARNEAVTGFPREKAPEWGARQAPTLAAAASSSSSPKEETMDDEEVSDTTDGTTSVDESDATPSQQAKAPPTLSQAVICCGCRCSIAFEPATKCHADRSRHVRCQCATAL